MSYKLFSIITLFISCIFTNTAYANALPNDWDTPDGEVGDPNKIPKNPSTQIPGTVPPPKPSKWNIIRKNIRKIAKPNLPEIGIALGGAAVDWLMDPTNNEAQTYPCKGNWTYSGYPLTATPQQMVKQVMKNIGTTKSTYTLRKIQDGHIAFDITHTIYGRTISESMVCVPEKAPETQDPPEGPDASPPQTQPKPDPNTKPSPSAPPVAPPAPGTEPQPQPNPQPQPRPDPNKDPESNPRPGADPQAPKGPDASPKPDPEKDPKQDPKPRPDPKKEPEKDPNAKPDPKKESDKEPKPDPKKEPDKEPNKDPEKDPNAKPDKEQKPFELPPFCAWATKVCEFIDWVKAEPQLPDEEQVSYKDVEYKDPSQFDKSYVAFADECPSYSFKIPVGTAKIDMFFDISAFCSFLSTFAKPVIILIAYVKAAFFVASGLKVG